MAQHFSSIFKPISSCNDIDQTATTMDQEITRRGLSLWVSQEAIGSINNNNGTIQENNIHHHHHHHHHHQIIGSSAMGCSSSGTILGQDPVLISSSSDHYELTWPIFGNKLSSNNAAHEELANVSVPSLYSNQSTTTTTSTTGSANMSATALLQKAAQIGATSSDPSFLGSFGLKCSATSSNSSQFQEGNNKFCGLMYGTTTNNNLDDLQMYPAATAAKRQKIMIQREQESGGSGGGVAGGQTRDFLGVGVQQAICHPSSINGWI